MHIQKLSGHSYIRHIAGHLCDSTAFLYYLFAVQIYDIVLRELFVGHVRSSTELDSINDDVVENEEVVDSDEESSVLTNSSMQGTASLYCILLFLPQFFLKCGTDASHYFEELDPYYPWVR